MCVCVWCVYVCMCVPVVVYVWLCMCGVCGVWCGTCTHVGTVVAMVEHHKMMQYYYVVQRLCPPQWNFYIF